MKVLILGGTRFWGINAVTALIEKGHSLTIATRGKTPDPFGDRVERVTLERRDAESVTNALSGCYFDAVIDNMAFSSNDIKRVLDVIRCDRYLLASTSGVYPMQQREIDESFFDAKKHPLMWGERDWGRYGIPGDFDYDEGKRQAEAALEQCYDNISRVELRFPVIMGENDYTKRLRFYTDHIMQDRYMNITGIDSHVCFINAQEAGNAAACLLERDITGALNVSSAGDISVREILSYLEDKTGHTALLSADGDPAPYNGFLNDYTLSTQRAEDAGIQPYHISEWLFPLLNQYLKDYER